MIEEDGGGGGNCRRGRARVCCARSFRSFRSSILLYVVVMFVRSRWWSTTPWTRVQSRRRRGAWQHRWAGWWGSVWSRMSVTRSVTLALVLGFVLARALLLLLLLATSGGALSAISISRRRHTAQTAIDFVAPVSLSPRHLRLTGLCARRAGQLP